VVRGGLTHSSGPVSTLSQSSLSFFNVRFEGATSIYLQFSKLAYLCGNVSGWWLWATRGCD